MKNVLIVGAGHGGIMAAVGLAKKKIPGEQFQITVVDKRDYHLFNPNLYEIAAADEEFEPQARLKKSIAVPLAEIFSGTGIRFVKGEVLDIDRTSRTVSIRSKLLPYDYLVAGFGSRSDYFGIPGAERYALPLKSLPDALRIKNQLEFAMENGRMSMQKPNLRVVVAGGGYTGVELAAELSHEIRLLCWKNQFPPEKVEIVVLEASPSVISGFSARLSRDALARLKDLGVRVRLSSPIISVDPHFVDLVGGERMLYDVLIWAAGIRAAQMPFAQPLRLDNKGRILVNKFLQAEGDDRIFAIGDCACVTDAVGKPVPSTARNASLQGDYVARALPYFIKNHRPPAYLGSSRGLAVTLGGRTAVVSYGFFYWNGYLAYLARMVVHLHYFARIVGWRKAVFYAWLDWDTYGRND